MQLQINLLGSSGKKGRVGKDGKVFIMEKVMKSAISLLSTWCIAARSHKRAEELSNRNKSIKDSRKFPSLLSKGGCSEEAENYQDLYLKRWDLIDKKEGERRCSCCLKRCQERELQWWFYLTTTGPCQNFGKMRGWMRQTQNCNGNQRKTQWP